MYSKFKIKLIIIHIKNIKKAKNNNFTYFNHKNHMILTLLKCFILLNYQKDFSFQYFIFNN